MLQVDGKKKVVCKNRKCSLVLDGNLNVYLPNDNTNFWIHFE